MENEEKAMTHSIKLFFLLGASYLLLGVILMPTNIYQIEVSPNVTCFETLFRVYNLNLWL